MFKRARQILSQAKQIKQDVVALAHEVLSTRPIRLRGPFGLACRYKVVPPRMHIGQLGKTFYQGDILECIRTDTIMIDGKPLRVPNLKAAFAAGWLVPQSAPMPDWNKMQRSRYQVSVPGSPRVPLVPVRRDAEKAPSEFWGISVPIEASSGFFSKVANGGSCSDMSIEEISSLWGYAPDVSGAFGVDTSAVYKPLDDPTTRMFEDEVEFFQPGPAAVEPPTAIEPVSTETPAVVAACLEVLPPEAVEPPVSTEPVVTEPPVEVVAETPPEVEEVTKSRKSRKN